MAGGNLSFAKDNLYKLEYSFNSIERVGTPGVTGEGSPTPTVKFKMKMLLLTSLTTSILLELIPTILLSFKVVILTL